MLLTTNTYFKKLRDSVAQLVSCHRIPIHKTNSLWPPTDSPNLVHVNTISHYRSQSITVNSKANKLKMTN